jgi:plasmid stability protein
MATTITLKNIPDVLYLRLKEASNAHHRSLNGEVLACLEQSLLPVKTSVSDHLANARQLRQNLAAYDFDADEIANAIQQGRE